MSSWHRNSALAALLLASSAVWAAPEAVVIRALRDPVDKSYRKMVQGMELFHELHAMAPNAELRYKLWPRKRDTDMNSLALQIVGESFALPVAVAPDRTFSLERNAKALEEDAVVRLDRKAQSMTWRAEIRTPGLAPDTRRLGDLRLECHVGMEAGLVSDYPPLLGPVMTLMQKVLDFCNDREVPYLFFAERPLFSVTMSAGSRRQVLAVGQMYAGRARGLTPKEELSYCDCEVLLDRAYVLPLGDRSWPDDTVIELEYMDAALPAAAKALPGDDATAAVIIGKSTKADVVAAMGEGVAIGFDSGFELWAYQFGPQKRPLARTEFVVLFSPSGTVAKTRLRLGPPPAGPKGP